MDKRIVQQLIRKMINRERWTDILSRFIDVLKVNIFIIDAYGQIVLPPERNKYGGRLLTDPSLGFDLICEHSDYIDKFDHFSQFLESINRYDLHCFAIPIYSNGKRDHPIAYLMVGPVIINKRLLHSDYAEMAKEYGVESADEVFIELNTLRVMSNVAVSAVLDLLTEIIKSNIDPAKRGEMPEARSMSSTDSGGEVFSVDEVLTTLLDVALNMTSAECGSIMIVDESKEFLVIRISKGLDKRRVSRKHVKMGEGIAGIAAKENQVFHISGNKSDNRIKHLLKRPEIKESFIMPLVKKDNVFGVLNLHTKRTRNRIKHNINNLQYLSKLLAAAV